MFCRKCGKPTEDSSVFCPSCGTRVDGAIETHSAATETSTLPSTPTPLSVQPNGAYIEKAAQAIPFPEMLVEKRILIFAALVGAILTLIGLFTPWISVDGWGFSLSASAWDSVITAGVLGEEVGREVWAILALVGTVIIVASSLTALAFPKTKMLLRIVVIGGILAIVSAFWALSGIDTGTAYGFSVSYGAGLYLTSVGGLLGLVGGALHLRFDLKRKSSLD